MIHSRGRSNNRCGRSYASVIHPHPVQDRIDPFFRDQTLQQQDKQPEAPAYPDADKQKTDLKHFDFLLLCPCRLLLRGVRQLGIFLRVLKVVLTHHIQHPRPHRLTCFLFLLRCIRPVQHSICDRVLPLRLFPLRIPYRFSTSTSTRSVSTFYCI